MATEIKYHRGSLQIDYGPETAHVFDNSTFFTRHYDKDKPYRVYCMHNNTAIQYFRRFDKWFSANVQGYNELREKIFTPVYPAYKPVQVPRIDLDGITLKPHQEVSVNLMLTYSKLALFYGTGTGKTYMALTYLKSMLATREVHAVVITKNAVVPQYAEEAAQFLNMELFTNALKYSKSGRSTMLVVNYEQMHNVPHLNITDLIFDESHMFKNFTSGHNKQASRLSSLSENTYLFTGTPKDAWEYEKFAQYKVLYPELVPSKTHFMDRYYSNLSKYNKPDRNTVLMHHEELQEINRMISYGGDTEKLLDLPPSYDYIIDCKFRDKSIYNTLSKDNIYRINSTLAIVSPTIASLRMKQRQLCNGFAVAEQTYFDDEEETYKTKPYTMDLENPKELPLKGLVSTLDTGIIFTMFKKDIENISRYMQDVNRTFAIVDGSISKKQSAININDFKSGKVDFLVMQIQSGSTGLDLKNTNNVIFYSLPNKDFVLYSQAKYRIRRIGQTKDCNYYHLLTKGTIEKGILRDLGVKGGRHDRQFNIY